MEIQWFPGHMAKTLRQIKENIRLVDFVIELLDARIPQSSSNPELERIIPPGKRIVALNKSDLADPTITIRWIDYYKDKSVPAFAIDSIKGDGISELVAGVSDLGADTKEKWQRRGRKQKPIRVMIAGIPNVGKSSLINRIAKKSAAKTGGRPGVTRGRQWIKLTGQIDLLDTPGVLWHKFQSRTEGINLALTGAVKEEILDSEELAVHLVDRLKECCKPVLAEYYDVPNSNGDSYDVLQQIGSARGCLLRGGKTDTKRASVILLNDYRSGRLGRISLESP